MLFNAKLTATGYRLKRGYKTRTNMEDKPRDIDHLVFVVHGIGQKRDTGKIIRNTTWYKNNIHSYAIYRVFYEETNKLLKCVLQSLATLLDA